MTDLETAKKMSRLLRSRWGRGARMRELDSRTGSASIVVYDSVKISLEPATEGIALSCLAAIPALPVFQLSKTVQPADVDRELAQIDASVRANLPADFLAAIDTWAAGGGEISSLPTRVRTPGPHITHEEIELHIADFWGRDISQVRSSGDARSRTLARIYGKIDISFSTESAHGELIGGIVLADGIAVSVFGTWLSADHSDTVGLSRICGLIDGWARLRLDLRPRLSAG